MSRYILRSLFKPSTCAGYFHSSAVRSALIPPTKPKPGETEVGVKTTDLVRVKDYFENEGVESNYDGKKFIKSVEEFHNLRKIKRFGYAEFVAAALPAMKTFGVEKNLEAYKALMRIFPAGAFVPQTKVASWFYPHYIQQKKAIDILCQMEANKIMPDKEMESIVIAAFSKYSQVWEKHARMTYWFTKFKNANPFPFPEEIPEDPLELAIVALKRMQLDPQAEITVYNTHQIEDTKEDTWIAFAQSESQCRLIDELDPEKFRVSVDGPFTVWVEGLTVSHFVLFARDMTPKGNVGEDKVQEILDKEHELHDVSNLPLANFGYNTKEEALDPSRKLHVQEDGTVLATLATGTSSQESLIAFVRMLEKENPRLRSIPVIISNQENASTTSQPPPNKDTRLKPSKEAKKAAQAAGFQP